MRHELRRERGRLVRLGGIGCGPMTPQAASSPRTSADASPGSPTGRAIPCFATDVKVYNPLCRARRRSPPTSPRQRSPAPDANPSPSSRRTACRLRPPAGTGHTFWADGNAHETAMTTAWPPNKVITNPAASATSTSRPTSSARAARPSPRSPRGATTPAASTPCSATAASASSRARSTATPGVPSGRSRGGEVVSSDSY